MKRTHILKTDWQQYDAIHEGRKRAEFRLDDRNFQEGDELILVRQIRFRDREDRVIRIEPTGHKLIVEITHILRGGYGMPTGYAMLSLSDVIAWCQPGEDFDLDEQGEHITKKVYPVL